VDTVLALALEDVDEEGLVSPHDAKTISVTVVRRILILMNSLSLSHSPITIRKHHKYSGIDFDVDAL
jgi:hypothetical protein